MADVDDDLERSLLASDVLSFSAVCAQRAKELVGLAREAAAAAVDHPASGFLTEAANSMARAAMALSVADAYSRPRAAVELVASTAKLSMAARELHNVELAAAAYHLAEQGEELTRMAADLRDRMQGLASQRSRGILGRVAAFCTSRLRPSSVRSFSEGFASQRSRGILGRVAAFCTSRARPSSVRSFSEGGTSAMQPLGLGLSLCLLPYMGRQGILSTDNFSNDDLWWINIIFSSWWIVVSLGVAAGLCPEYRLLMEYVRLSSHLSMLGITVLVILYGYVMLAPAAGIAVLIFLVVSCVFHIGFYVESWYRRGL